MDRHNDSGGLTRSCRDTDRSVRCDKPPSRIASASILPPKKNQVLRNGSIIKGYRRGLHPKTRNETGNDTMKQQQTASQAQLPKCLFIVNGTKTRQWQEVFPQIAKELQPSVNMQVCFTKYSGHGRKLARKAAGSGADLIVAVGGDGTLNEVVDGVMRAGALGDNGLPHPVISVLPLGTGSDFHRSMSWDPQDFKKAVKRLLSDTTVVLDVGKVRCVRPKKVENATGSRRPGVTERYFINVASSGASAHAARTALHWGWTKGLRYRMAGLEGLIRQKPQTLALRLDGGEWQKVASTNLIAAGNGSYFGGGYKITPGGNPFDGKLNVVVGSSVGVLDFLINGNRLRQGTHVDMNKFASYDATTLDVGFWDAKDECVKVDNDAITVFGFDQSIPMSGAITTELSVGSSSVSSESGRSDVSSRSWDNASLSIKDAADGGSSSNKSKYNKDKLDYGAMPLEVDGEVIGQAPFSITVIPKAIKFRIALKKGKA